MICSALSTANWPHVRFLFLGSIEPAGVLICQAWCNFKCREVIILEKVLGPFAANGVLKEIPIHKDWEVKTRIDLLN